MKLNLALDQLAMDYRQTNQDIDLPRIKELMEIGAKEALRNSSRILRDARAEIRMARIKAARES